MYSRIYTCLENIKAFTVSYECAYLNELWLFAPRKNNYGYSVFT